MNYNSILTSSTRRYSLGISQYLIAKQRSTSLSENDDRTASVAAKEKKSRQRLKNHILQSILRKFENMRSDVVIIIATLGLLFTHGTRCTRSYTAHYVKHRTKPREIRGFQPEILSTAYGFGKRDGGAFGVMKPHNHQNMILALLQKSTQRLANRRAACQEGNTSFKFALCE